MPAISACAILIVLVLKTFGNNVPNIYNMDTDAKKVHELSPSADQRVPPWKRSNAGQGSGGTKSESDSPDLPWELPEVPGGSSKSVNWAPGLDGNTKVTADVLQQALDRLRAGISSDCAVQIQAAMGDLFNQHETRIAALEDNCVDNVSFNALADEVKQLKLKLDAQEKSGSGKPGWSVPGAQRRPPPSNPEFLRVPDEETISLHIPEKASFADVAQFVERWTGDFNIHQNQYKLTKLGKDPEATNFALKLQGTHLVSRLISGCRKEDGSWIDHYTCNKSKIIVGRDKNGWQRKCSWLTKNLEKSFAEEEKAYTFRGDRDRGTIMYKRMEVCALSFHDVNDTPKLELNRNLPWRLATWDKIVANFFAKIEMVPPCYGDKFP